MFTVLPLLLLALSLSIIIVLWLRDDGSWKEKLPYAIAITLAFAAIFGKLLGLF